MRKVPSLVVLLGLAVAAFTSPIEQKRWSLVRDGNGNVHLDDTQYSNPIEPEKQFVAAEVTTFHLFTRANPTVGQEIVLDDAASLQASNFNSANPTRIIIHGWSQSRLSDVNTVLTNAWLTRGEFNVIVVDWEEGANTLLYRLARGRIVAVAGVISSFINFLVSAGGIAHNSIYIAGHNLGAHIAGSVGFFQFMRINTIYGLDASYELFDYTSSDRLNQWDAQYVESIHTNVGNNGFDLPLGQAAFYPNGIGPQPGCGIDLTGNCAHARAIFLLAESIISGGFTSIPCQNFNQVLEDTCVIDRPTRRMGGEPSNQGTGARGVYKMTTRASSPFSLD
ncbi:lipase member H-like [Uranotaenia lowii]|uniref:lipase member H-like n=1 Tax=Uranotaenia lowii TaxID=190385 RepID=UPI00247B22A6|nr:lipase member H-like [Uranotaenia lowii]